MNLFYQNDDATMLLKKGLSPFTKDNNDAPIMLTCASCVQSSNSTVDTLLEHILCAGRIAHYIKIIARQKIGAHEDENSCERLIKDWLRKYTGSVTASNLRHKYPLKSSNVQISKVPGKIGHYNCKIKLEPHMHLEQLSSLITLNSEIIIPS